VLDYDELKAAFLELGLAQQPVIVHASLQPFGYIHNGADTVLMALIDSVQSLIMPTFTYKTMITPDVGPPNNGIAYGAEKDLNRMAQSFTPDMRADAMMGILPESLRNHPAAKRTAHPILSFAGINADLALNTQTLFEPFAPIGELADADGWAMLINVDHSVNTSIHYAEKLAGRKQFVRWAVMDNRIVECPNFPGDSTGFNAIASYIKPDTRRVEIGEAFIEAVPLRRLFAAVQELINLDPLALLCQRTDCERCDAIRTQ
jgi:aminoglycoside 3-N-acetyltransferase